MSRIITLIFLFNIYYGAEAMFEMYCGEENCYEILKVTRDSSRNEVVKAYRKLARQWHPDRYHVEEEREKAHLQFLRIATAYEVLKDDESRKDYDYMLDHPDEFYMNYYRYYRRRVTPQVDARIVIAVTITVISCVQYFNARSSYTMALDYFATVPKYRNKAMEIAETMGLWNQDAAGGKRKAKSKAQLRAEKEEVIRTVLAENMDIRGSLSQPSLRNVLWVQIVFLPYSIYLYIYWFVRWVWKFNIHKEEYGLEEHLYLIRKHLGVSQGYMDALEDNVRDDYLRLELWKKDKFVVWKQTQDTEERIRLAESGRYKSYRRYMKKGGPGRMTFEDD